MSSPLLLVSSAERILSRSSRGAGIAALPPELWEHILSLAPPPDAWQARLVCRDFFSIVTEDVSPRWMRTCFIGGVWPLARSDEWVFRIEDDDSTYWPPNRWVSTGAQAGIIGFALPYDPESDNRPRWLDQLRRTQINVFISMQQFHVGPSVVLYSSGAWEVKEGLTQEGFQVQLDSTPPTIFLHTKALVSSMFKAPQFRYVDPEEHGKHSERVCRSY